MEVRIAAKGVPMKNGSIRLIRTAGRRVAAVGAGVMVGGALVGATMITGAATAGATGPPVVVNCASGSLQTAINDAAPGGIVMATGTCPGSFTIDKDLTVLGQGTTVLDGQAAGRVLSVAAGANVRLASLTITDGSALTGAGIDNRGMLRLQDVTLTDNTAQQYGGGIVNSGNGTIWLQGSTVTGNDGGGVVNFPGDSALLQNSVVSDNNALFAGGLANGGTMTLQNSVVSGNTAGIGAGIDNDTNASLTLDGSTVTDNTAFGFGGGIYNLGMATLNGSTVTNNTPDNCNPIGSVAGCFG